MKGKLAVIAAAVTAASFGVASPAFAGGPPTACPTTPAAQTGAPDGNPAAHNFGGDCTIAGTITIASAIQLATNVTSFALNSTALNTPSPTFQIQVASNVPTGYNVSESGPAGGFADGAGHFLPDSAVSMWTLDGGNTNLPTGASCATVNNNGGYTALPDPSTVPNVAAELVVASGGVSGAYNCGTFTGYTVPGGDDSFDIHGWELTTVNGEVTGTYTGNVQMAAWGN